MIDCQNAQELLWLGPEGKLVELWGVIEAHCKDCIECSAFAERAGSSEDRLLRWGALAFATVGPSWENKLEGARASVMARAKRLAGDPQPSQDPRIVTLARADFPLALAAGAASVWPRRLPGRLFAADLGLEGSSSLEFSTMLLGVVEVKLCSSPLTRCRLTFLDEEGGALAEAEAVGGRRVSFAASHLEHWRALRIQRVD